MITYQLLTTIQAQDFVDILERSGLAQRRPVENTKVIAGMLEHADLLVSAWDGELLVGIARSVTDFDYCCYLSDLAVDRAYQRGGIGRELIRQTREQLGADCLLILLAAPAAAGYYPGVGFKPHASAWILYPGDPLK